MKKTLLGLCKLVFVSFCLVVVFSPISALAQQGKININTASAEELDTLPNIGQVLAGRIVEYRQTHGNFNSIEEVKNVSGIGEATFQDIKDLITVGGGGEIKDDDEEEPDKENDDKSDNEDNDDSDSDGNPSAHSSPVDLSRKEAEVDLEIDAGRQRLTIAGGEVEFSVEVTAGFDARVNFDWSFGDGSSSSGQTVTHVYNHPGLYNVVVNAEGAGGEAVDRTKVQVVTADLDLNLSENKEAVVVTNNTDWEVNVGEFIISSGEENFSLARDTIIEPNNEIHINLQRLGFDLNKIASLTLKNKTGQEMAQVKLASTLNNLTVSDQEALAQIKKEADRLASIINTRAQALNSRPVVVHNRANYSDDNLIAVGYNNEVDDDKTVATTSSGGGGSNSIVLSREPNWWKKILLLPDRGLALIGNIF